MANISDQEFLDAVCKFKEVLGLYEQDIYMFARSVTIRRKKNGELLDFVVNFTMNIDNVEEQMK
jgi:hypothetical protein